MTTQPTMQETVAPQRMPERRVVAPRTDVYEREDALVLVADVPGVDPGHVEVSLENDTLTLRARAGEDEPTGHDALYQEYAPVNYERAFTLAEDIDAERVKATVRQGVLTVVLPKSPKAQPRKISVSAE